MDKIFLRIKKYFWCKEFKNCLSKHAEIEGGELECCYKAELKVYIDEGQLWKDYSPTEAVLKTYIICRIKKKTQ